jgi:hypothetical protein
MRTLPEQDLRPSGARLPAAKRRSASADPGKALEGGAEEVPATTYKDILTVTVTPLAATAPGEVC